MKKVQAIFLLFISSLVNGQNFPGLRSGNYTGVTGVFQNPANIADSRYKWDVNLLGVHGYLGNNNASFSLSDITNSFNPDSDLFFQGSANNTVSGQAYLDALLPSFMITLDPKTSIAFTTRARVMANMHNLDGGVIDALEESSSTSLPFSLQSSGVQKIAATAWTEWGASLGRVLLQDNHHFLKAGLSIKYLGGASHSFLNFTNLRGTVAEDPQGNTYLTNAGGTIGIGFSGYALGGDTDNTPFQFNGGGVGADIGLVYEYRPNADLVGSFTQPYKWKASLALLDIGSIKFSPLPAEFAGYSFSIGNLPDRLDLQQFENSTVEEIKAILDADPRFVNNMSSSGSYRAGMPATLQAGLDVALTSKLYAELHLMTGLGNKNNPYNLFMPTAISLTPRFETPHFGAYLPLNYNQLTGFNAGIALRAGPFFIGSGSFLTAALGQSKQADVLVGLRFGGLQKRPHQDTK